MPCHDRGSRPFLTAANAGARLGCHAGQRAMALFERHEMNRNLKHLAAALAAALAIGALTASAASAAPKLTPSPEEYPVNIDLHGEWHLFLQGGRRITCTKTLQLVVNNKAEAEESGITATPTFTNCTATILGNAFLATVTMNGCDTKLTFEAAASGTIASEGWEVTGSRHVKCPAGKEIEIHVFASEAKDKENVPLCTYKIAEQGPNKSVDYKFTEKNAEGAGTGLDIRTTITGTRVTRASGTVTNCGEATQESESTGEASGSALNSKGEMIRMKWDF